MRRLALVIADVVIYLALRLGILACKILPKSFLLSASKIAADLAFHLFHSIRKRCTRNLTLALGERFQGGELSAVVRGSMRNLSRSIVELGLALETSPEDVRKEMPVIGLEHVDAAMAKGKGVIVLSGHLGNFFLVGMRLAVEGYPAYVLVNRSRARYSRQLRDRYRLKLGQKTISARPRREAFRRMVEVLRQNGLVVVIADEFRSGSGIEVPFFGRTVLARRGPATLALRTGAPIVPTYLVRQAGGQLALIIEPELELATSRRTRAEITENTRRVTQWLERTVRSYPDQWNWTNIQWQGDSSTTFARKEPHYEEVA